MDRDEVQKMIDLSIEKAIDKHNKTATLISSSLGFILLFFYAHGLITIIERLK